LAILKEDVTLHTFTAEASAGLDGPEWLRARRTAGYEAAAASSLPSESEEVWRYTPINTLVLDDFAPPVHDAPAPAGDQLLAALTTALGPVAGSVLVHNGRASTLNAPDPGGAGGGA
jgi:hypothetical protein